MPDPFRLANFLPFRLNVLASEVSERMSAIYSARFGLDIPQWRILANLAVSDGITAQRIARITRSHKSTVSRAVQDLEDRGLITRDISKSDKRAYALRLSTDGRRLFRQLLPHVLAFEAELIRRLSDGDAKALLRGLGALENALKNSREAAP